MIVAVEPCMICCTIVNKRGLHARASAKLSKLAAQFKSEISVEHNGVTVPAASLMGLLTLGAGRGKKICITCSGPDSEAACHALSDLIIRGFDEDDNDGS